ncbi:glucose PTS transporter transcription antiterminator GlcT [Staphylospora marina]|uniref:glucose PTS transporter transcription antiterminator GlcT n=1 Tax=Staphylospora marina TaxID=2490858 RepID=UPI000F5BC209|nr:PRD domain-containing protein [Staphylospora marina]
MERSYRISKVLNNNVVIAEHPEKGEVVLIGKGLGFGRKPGGEIGPEAVDKCFVLADRKEQEQYKELLRQVDERVVEVMNEAIDLIQKRFGTPLGEHIHVALTDHIAFALKRLEKGIDFRNPFLLETEALYEREYKVAEEVVDLIRRKLGVRLPEGETGFIAVHIHSSLTRRKLAEIRRHSQLIQRLTELAEETLGVNIDRKSVSYLRLLTHLRCAIERTLSGEEVSEPEGFSELLRNQYPLCYNLAWKMAKVMERALEKRVHPAEVGYLTLHLLRLSHP